MKNQLSKEEINELFTFVESKNIKYLDVQHEIVDHLASAIEDVQKADPALSFNKVLNQVYSKFPITGFAVMVLAKESELKRFWVKKFLSFMLSYMKLPKIIIAAFLIFIFQTVLSTGLLINPKQLYFILIILTLCSAAYRYKYGFEFKKEFRNKYLVTNSYLFQYGGIWMAYFFIPYYISLDTTSEISYFGNISSWLLSSYITLAFLWIHAYTFEFPKMLKQELEEKYSHLNIKLA